MNKKDKKLIKEYQNIIRGLYWKAVNKDPDVAPILEALDYRIEYEVFGYDGD